MRNTTIAGPSLRVLALVVLMVGGLPFGPERLGLRAEPLGIGEAFAASNAFFETSRAATSPDGSWYVQSRFCPDPQGLEIPMADFVRAQLDEAARLGLIDCDRVVAVGQSSGGWATAILLTQPGLFAAGVSINGGYDMTALYGYAVPREDLYFYASKWISGYHGRMGTHPWGESMPRYLEASPYHQAERIQAPLLLIHGGEDSAFPVHDAQAMYLALRTLNKPARLVIYPRQNHNVRYWRRDFAVHSVEQILEFLSETVLTKT